MPSMNALRSSSDYLGSADSTTWEGCSVGDVQEFKDFLRDVVSPRISDTESGFEADIRALATTGMATEFVERLLNAVPEPKDWEVGEAFAECTLSHETSREFHWPWNLVRDRRTPRASLPGADLVGFCRDGDTVVLLIGEVKTSADIATPPGVMYGGSGMTWQLNESATRLDIQCTLLQWLFSRCTSDFHRDLYAQAVTRYLNSNGKELLLVGILVRDTQPNELDLKNRAIAFSQEVSTPGRAEFIAWYLPVPIAEWPQLLNEEAPS